MPDTLDCVTSFKVIKKLRKIAIALFIINRQKCYIFRIFCGIGELNSDLGHDLSANFHADTL